MKITHCLLIALSLLVCSPSHAGVWQSTSPMNTARGGAGVVEVDGRLYVIGGVDGIRFLSTSEYTTIQGDGSLSPWQKASTLNEERGFFGVAAHKGYLYAVGGGNGPNGHNLLRSVERAAVSPDGKLGPWRREASQLNLPRRCAKVAVIGDYLYAFGGVGGTLLDTVERARIQRDGSLAAWEVLPGRFRMPRYIHAMAATDHALYAIGGRPDETRPLRPRCARARRLRLCERRPEWRDRLRCDRTQPCRRRRRAGRVAGHRAAARALRRHRCRELSRLAVRAGRHEPRRLFHLCLRHAHRPACVSVCV